MHTAHKVNIEMHLLQLKPTKLFCKCNRLLIVGWRISRWTWIWLFLLLNQNWTTLTIILSTPHIVQLINKYTTTFSNYKNQSSNIKKNLEYQEVEIFFRHSTNHFCHYLIYIIISMIIYETIFVQPIVKNVASFKDFDWNKWV